MSEEYNQLRVAEAGNGYKELPCNGSDNSIQDAASRDDEPNEINLGLLLDVPVEISIEMGSARMNIGKLLELKRGTVVELDRFAGEPLDVLVNGTLVAHGEVVVINEKFGIRLTDVVSPAERVKRLA